MVKIVNTLGEIKTGVQGAAVYQGIYGHQIRRTRQPKRAIPSQKQLEHRQLYREALAWRKALSLPIRRYLEGYCIANWIVDDYKIPLPWSRFALKLYLQHIAFVMVEKPVMVYLPAYEDKTEEQTVHNTDIGMKGTNAPTCGQRLTIPDRKVVKLAFLLKKVGAPTGDISFTIRKVSDKSLIVSKFWGNSSEVPTELTWLEVEFDDPTDIDTEVRCLIEYTGYNASNYLSSRLQASDVKADECWTRGSVASPVDMATWDFVYRYTYREEAPPPYGYDYENSTPGLLHVRHPALLSGEHRREGKLLATWTNLSNLDEEYITKQVGVDVFSGETLKFDTIAGEEYSFRVP